MHRPLSQVPYPPSTSKSSQYIENVGSDEATNWCLICQKATWWLIWWLWPFTILIHVSNHPSVGCLITSFMIRTVHHCAYQLPHSCFEPSFGGLFDNLIHDSNRPSVGLLTSSFMFRTILHSDNWNLIHDSSCPSLGSLPSAFMIRTVLHWDYWNLIHDSNCPSLDMFGAFCGLNRCVALFESILATTYCTGKKVVVYFVTCIGHLGTWIGRTAGS
jgi:hypothetical protein